LVGDLQRGKASLVQVKDLLTQGQRSSGSIPFKVTSCLALAIP
jgi:hypothetical protein